MQKANAPELDAARKATSETSLSFLLRDTSRVLLRALQDRVSRSGITLNQHFILRELSHTDGLTVRELAQRIRIVDPTITTTISALEKKKLVQRNGSMEDRRQVHVYLTQRGRDLHTELSGGTTEINDAAFAGLPPGIRTQLRNALVRVRENLEAYIDDPD